MKNSLRNCMHVLMILCSISLWSCSSDEEKVIPEIKPNKDTVLFGKDGGEETVYISANTTIKVVSDDLWCDVKEEFSSSEKNKKFKITAERNNTTEIRNTVITITGADLTEKIYVTQDAGTHMEVNTNQISVDETGGIVSVVVNSSGEYTIEIANESWVKHIQTKAVTQNTEEFEVSMNPMTEKRSTTITFTFSDITEVVTIYQSGMSVPDPDKSGMESDATELVKKMYLGWNLGNSLEVPGSEVMWGNPRTTKDMIDAVKAAGINAVRIPCAWDSYLEDETTFKIKESWLARVQEVVDYCVDNEMYAIINIHWDGGWLEKNCTTDKQEEVGKKQQILWTQIASYFRHYDEHLLFAGCNEPDVINSTGMSVLKYYEQVFIDAVRATGGRNVYRNLIVQGPLTSIDKTYELMDMPTDPTPNRLMAEVHYYDPWQFCLKEDDGEQRWEKLQYFWGAENQKHATGDYSERWNDYGNEDYILEQFGKMKSMFTDKNIPVILGEFGAIQRTIDDPVIQNLHNESIAYFHKYVTEQAKNHGMVPFIWDMGGDMSVFDRKNNMKVKEFLLQGLIDGANAGNYPF